MSFDLVHYAGVVERAAVLLEVDGLGLRLQQVEFAARVVVALFESLESGCRLTFEAEGGGDFGPVEFQGGGALGQVSVGFNAALSESEILEELHVLLLPFLRFNGNDCCWWTMS